MSIRTTKIFKARTPRLSIRPQNINITSCFYTCFVLVYLMNISEIWNTPITLPFHSNIPSSSIFILLRIVIFSNLAPLFSIFTILITHPNNPNNS